MDVSLIPAGWPGSGRIVVFPKQEATLWQSLECHFVCATNLNSRIGGVAAFQPADKAEIQFRGDTNHYPCPRQFLVCHPLQGFSVLQKGLSGPI